MFKRKAHYDTSNLRLTFLTLGFLFIHFVFIVRLFQIQVLDHKKYFALAQQQYWDSDILPAKRGDILSSDNYPLATTQVSYLVYVEPQHIEDKAAVTTALVTFLAAKNKFEAEDPTDYYLTKLTTIFGSKLLWAKVEGSLTPDEKQKLENLHLAGVGFEEEPLRYYTEKSLAAHVLGFVAHDEAGQPRGYFGIEGKLDGDLQGKPGKVLEEKDAVGNPILYGGIRKIEPVDGRDVYLTLDRSTQYVIEQKLKAGVEEYDAVSGSVVVMDPMSGNILALANYPTYDPANFNDFGEAPKAESRRKQVERVNLAVSQTYEPGSVLKPLTVSAAIDLKKVTPQSTYVDSGPVRYSDYVIDNWDGKHHGVMTVIQLLQKSNNIGAAWVGHLVGSDNLAAYLTKFGLGTVTGIELEGEDTGIIRDPKLWTDIDLATVSFGQGISATPLQVLNAFNVIANGGELIRPRLVDKLVENDKVIVLPKKVLGRVISTETAKTMQELLVLAVEGGESKYFNLKTYKIAGKTGTAQIPENGKYNPQETNATFVGYLQTSKKFSMLVKLEQPKSSIYAAETAVPLWMAIASELVKLYGIPPDFPVAEEPTPKLVNQPITPTEPDSNVVPAVAGASQP